MHPLETVIWNGWSTRTAPWKMLIVQGSGKLGKRTLIGTCFKFSTFNEQISSRMVALRNVRYQILVGGWVWCPGGCLFQECCSRTLFAKIIQNQNFHLLFSKERIPNASYSSSEALVHLWVPFWFGELLIAKLVYQLKEVFCRSVETPLSGGAQDPQDVFSRCRVH